MKNYNYTLVFIFSLIIIICIIVTINLNKYENFQDYYVQGCNTNEFGGSQDLECVLCKSCDGEKDDSGTGSICNSTTNKCYRSGCSSSNPGTCKKIADCSTTDNRYKYRYGGRQATEGDVGEEGVCKYINCPSNKYIDSSNISQLRQGETSLSNIHNNMCQNPPICSQSDQQLSGFVQANNGYIGSPGICDQKWKSCVNGSEYYDSSTNSCQPHGGNNNTKCISTPNNPQYIDSEGVAKTDHDPGRKIDCKPCKKTCDGEQVDKYVYNFSTKQWDVRVNGVICSNTEHCYRDACNTDGTSTQIGRCHHVSKTRCNFGQPLNGSYPASDSDYGSSGTCTPHQACPNGKYRIASDWKRVNYIEQDPYCLDFTSCSGNKYNSGSQKAVQGVNPSSAFGSAGSCTTCSGSLSNGVCTTCGTNEYINGNSCTTCQKPPNSDHDNNPSEIKTNQNQCKFKCHSGYKINSNRNGCEKCGQNEFYTAGTGTQYGNKSGTCSSCTIPLNSDHDNHPSNIKTNANQCKFKCKSGFKKVSNSCVACTKDEWYKTGTGTGYGNKSGTCESCPIVSNGVRNNPNGSKYTNVNQCKIKCNDGHKYQTSNGGAIKSCVKCGVGTALTQNTEGTLTTCNECEKGQFQNLEGTSSCKDTCQVALLNTNQCNSYTDQKGQSSPKTCTGFQNFAIRDTYSGSYSNFPAQGVTDGRAVGCFTDLGFGF